MASYTSTIFMLLVIATVEFRPYGAQQTNVTSGVHSNNISLVPASTMSDIVHTSSPKVNHSNDDSSYSTDFLTAESFTVESMDTPQELWLAHQITWPWWRIIQLLSAITGIVGNFIVMLVVFRPQKARRSTDTLLGALALADFLTSVFLIPIPDVSNIPPGWLGELYCKIIYTARFMWISVSASIFTLTAISVERYVAIVHPFKLRVLFSSSRTKLAVVIVWIMALILNSFAFVVFFVDADTQSCVLIFPTANGPEILGLTSFIIVLVLPMVVMLVTQSLTALSLHRESQRFKSADGSAAQSSARHLAARRRVIQLIFIINVIFAISWGPNQSAYLAFNLGYLPLSYLYGPLDRALVVLAFFNSCANPVIYTLQYPKFRKAVRDLFSRSQSERTPIFGQVEKPPATNPTE